MVTQNQQEENPVLELFRSRTWNHFFEKISRVWKTYIFAAANT